MERKIRASRVHLAPHRGGRDGGGWCLPTFRLAGLALAIHTVALGGPKADQADPALHHLRKQNKLFRAMRVATAQICDAFHLRLANGLAPKQVSRANMYEPHGRARYSRARHTHALRTTLTDDSERPERVKVTEGARILGVSARTVQLLAIRGELPSAAQIGRLWTFNEKKLRQFIADKEREAADVKSRSGFRGRAPTPAFGLCPNGRRRRRTKTRCRERTASPGKRSNRGPQPDGAQIQKAERKAGRAPESTKPPR
jgi:excisionase family DNA binding protein